MVLIKGVKLGAYSGARVTRNKRGSEREEGSGKGTIAYPPAIDKGKLTVRALGSQ